MPTSQTVTGYYDQVVEAQQAVQRLLDAGLAPDQVQFRPGPANPPSPAVEPTSEARNTGRFFSSIFGPTDPEATSPAAGTAVVVRVNTVAETQQVTGLLAGANSITHT